MAIVSGASVVASTVVTGQPQFDQIRANISNMGSIDRVARTEGTQPQVTDTAHGLTTPPRPVWVRLDALYIRDPGTPIHVNGAGIDMTGEVKGHLTHWIPTARGDWLGRVSYAVPYADGRPPLHLHDQLIPAYALRPRDEPW